VDQEPSHDTTRNTEGRWHNGSLCRFRVHPGMTKAATLQNCSVAELRQYTLHAGARKTLVSLFVSEFIQPQEKLDMAVSAISF
jgi:hypothetical protein